jgi:hypothetical protein
MLHDNENSLPTDHQIGANFPPEPIELVAEDKRVAELIEAANKWCEQYPTIEDDAVAAACMDYLNQLDANWTAFDERRKAEREPHNKALKEIQEKWRPRLDRIDICRRALRPLKQAWLRLKEARLKAEREAAEREAAEAQRRADQLAEQAKAGGPNAISQTIIALEATQQAEWARQAVAIMPRRAQVRGNLGGRTHSLRTVWKAEIIEIEKTFERYKSRREVIELLTSLANADVRNPRLWPNPEDRDIPGCYVSKTQE